MKIYIAEDDALLCEMLIEHLAEFCPGAEVVGANGNGQIAMLECMKLNPDLIILDIRLPELSGLDILHLIKEKFPQIKILTRILLGDSPIMNSAPSPVTFSKSKKASRS